MAELQLAHEVEWRRRDEERRRWQWEQDRARGLAAADVRDQKADIRAGGQAVVKSTILRRKKLLLLGA